MTPILALWARIMERHIVEVRPRSKPQIFALTNPTWATVTPPTTCVMCPNTCSTRTHTLDIAVLTAFYTSNTGYPLIPFSHPCSLTPR